MRLDQGKTFREINRFNLSVIVLAFALAGVAWLVLG